MKNQKKLNIGVWLKSLFLNKNNLIIILIIASIMINIYAYLSPNFLVETIKQVLYENNDNRVYLTKALDKFLLKEVPEGNLFIKFRGYGKLDKESDIDTPLLIYLRSFYTLYPRKTYVVAPEVVVNKGSDILTNQFNPTKVWLREHGVKKVITFTQREIIKKGKKNIETYNSIETVD